MNSFLEEIKKLEHDNSDTYDIRTGTIPVILSSAHGIKQINKFGSLKPAEPYTRGIAKYVGNKIDCYYLVKNNDTGVDSNKKNNDEYKIFLCDIIRKNGIKIMKDLHGAKKERDFDIEIGTLNGKSAKKETIDKLIECFHKNDIQNVALNDPFKGGDITKTVYKETEIECIQLEINGKYRSIHNIDDMGKVCNTLIMYLGTF